ncbi:MAG: UDP-4-amino-4,6-dideoxy-N-acetyl-beta-L-altrosamine N-acetyltransferase [Nitratireductor sp.]
MANKLPILDRLGQVRLKPLFECEKEALDRMRVIRNHPQVRSYMYNDQEFDEETHQRWLNSQHNNADNAIYGAFVDAILQGSVGLVGIDPVNRHAEWGFYLSPDLHGHGFGEAMLFNMLDLAFAVHPVDKVNSEVIEYNDGSLALHRRLGFRDEGRRRNHKLREGKFFDAILLGITRQEWADRRSDMITNGNG